jgi:hypothetical protein
MNREGFEDVSAFVALEVEATPANYARTLFLVGLHDPKWIVSKAKKYKCRNIYFGANQSFDPVDFSEWEEWTRTINTVLKEFAGTVTLDFDIKHAVDFLESGLAENTRFIPMISVKLPYINQFGYNAVLKLDDKDFDATNPGVWCHDLHTLQNPERITRWSEYRDDHRRIVATKSGVIPESDDDDWY